MKYFGKPAGMWAVFGGSFRRELVRCFGLSEQSARETARKAKKKYRELIGRLPEFEKTDRFMTNEVNCAMLASGKSQFTEKDIEGMRRTAALRAGDRNPYSWNMDFYEYPDGSGYEARFSRCGICTLMQELGLQDLTPALCHLDYTMAEARGSATFVREYTLASGGPYCDCGYKKRQK